MKPLLSYLALLVPALGLFSLGAKKEGERPAKVVDLGLAAGQLQVVPSFETCSYYFRPSAAAQPRVEFRPRGDSVWRRALAPVSDLPEGIWKGSIFGLSEDTEWEVRVLDAASQVLAQQAFRTWTSHPPIARTIDLSKLAGADGAGIVISEHGTPQGWIKYIAPPGWVMRCPEPAANGALAAITFRHASYVILENVTVVGGHRYGILVDDSNSVRVLNCEVSGWGRIGTQQFVNTGLRGKYLDDKGELINLDGGIEISRSGQTVVERCYVHDPRGRANSWMFSHPAGPEAMHVFFSTGGSVVRWNDFVGSDEHRWNDVIETTANSDADGGFFRDSDITGNYQAFGEDDGIELEGGGMNVRFYGNKVEGTLCGVSTGACVLGPQYVIGNLVANPGDESGLMLYFFKNSYPEPNDGRRFFINNTLYGPKATAYGSYGGPMRLTPRGFMRNNVFICSGARPPEKWASVDDFDNDLFWVNHGSADSNRFVGLFRAQAQEAHALAEDPALVNPDEGDYHLSAASVARARAVAVDDVIMAGTDLGGFAKYGELPNRPLALMAAPRQLRFDDALHPGERSVVLSLPASERTGIEFGVRQNEVFDWFKVSPSAGRIEPGQSLRLTVTVDPAKLTGRRLFRGAFLVRTPAGLSRPVAVYAAGIFHEDMRPPGAADSVYLDAARAPGLSGHVEKTPQPGTIGGTFVRIGQLALDYDVDLPKAGSYSVLLRARAADDVTAKHVYEVGLDGRTLTQKTELTTDFQWNADEPEPRFRVVYAYSLGPIAAGRHHLHFRLLRGNLDLNELILADKPAVYFDEYWQRPRS